MALCLDPFTDVREIETDEMTHLYHRYSPLSDHPPDIALIDSEEIGERRNVDEFGKLRLAALFFHGDTFHRE